VRRQPVIAPTNHTRPLGLPIASFEFKQTTPKGACGNVLIWILRNSIMKSNVEWRLWGKLDPLYGVASWAGRQRGGKNPWSDEEFYALGEDWHDFDKAWRSTVGYQPGIVLEIGSGAGRITRMLAQTFEGVVATDVSAEMLDYARARIPAQNVSWQVSDGDHIPSADGSVDAVFSCHVFQHFSSNEAQRATFAEVHRVLKPGGSFFVHLPIHGFPEANIAYSRLARAMYKGFLRLTAARASLRRMMIRAGLKRPYMHGISYEMPQLFADLADMGFSDLTFSAIKARASSGIHTCIAGRKAA
jgi:ubiquinone/menaquinone biosynthesis C-methylase UbiE